MRRFGAPHVVIANAGVSAGTLTEYEEDLAVFRRVMDINVYGMAATFAPFVPAMKATGGEQRLVGIASVAGICDSDIILFFMIKRSDYVYHVQIDTSTSFIHLVTALPYQKKHQYSIPFIVVL